MTKQNIRQMAIPLAMLIFLFVFAALPFSPIAVRAVNSENKFDNINVLDDLKNSTINGKPFDINKYPFDSTGKIKHPEIMNVVEYCYTFKLNMQGNYGLYLYFYNPQQLDIKTDSKANKVQIAVSYATNKDGNIVPASYEKFDLQFCSVSTEPNYYRLFYKFKVIDHVGADGKTILQRLNSNARRYDISGIELLTNGNINATEYTVGGTYTFTGYAKGYGADPNAESNLTCEVRNLETIRLDLAGTDDGIDKRTYWRSNSSSLGAHHQNQINSVFFAIDKKVLEKYGYILQKIKAEWWEYKTRPAVVIDDLRIFNSLSAFKGVKISENYDRTRNWILHEANYDYVSNGVGGIATYNWSWNGDLKSSGLNLVYSRDVELLLPLLFYTGGIDVNDYMLLPKILQEYFKTYNKSYEKGHLSFNEHDYSADLFANSVDNGRTMGYNNREFDLGNPNDYWDIRSYDSTHNWWDKLWDYGIGGITTNDDYPDISPIQMIKPEDLAVSDIANHLKINLDDTDRFKNYYNSVKKDCEVFIFRYAQTDYWAEDLTVFEINAGEYGTHHNGVGEIRQGTQFFDFDILEFTFNKNGEYTVIPVVSSPVDHISGYSPSVEPEASEWWKIFLMVLALILVLVLLFPVLPYILSLLIWLITLPFRAIASLFGTIFGGKNRKK